MRFLNLVGWLVFFGLLCTFGAAVAGWVTSSL